MATQSARQAGERPFYTAYGWAVLLVAGVTLPVVAPTATAAETAYTNLVAALAVILALAALLRPPGDHR
jgi:hypothetical protein